AARGGRAAPPARRRGRAPAPHSPAEAPSPPRFGQAARGFAQLVQPLLEARPLAELEDELTPRRAQRLVDAREHPPQAVGAVGREEPQPLGVAAGAERLERPLERLPAHDRSVRLVELA